jgi:leucyl/phenylalanyl-tRNA--protein transferase
MASAKMALWTAALKRNSFLGEIQHWLLSLAYALRPNRCSAIPYLAYVALRDHWGRRPVTEATWRSQPIEEHLGLVFMSSDLSVQTLLKAYSAGMFPFANLPPMKWWSPPERMLLAPASIKIERDVRRLMKGDRLDIRFDSAFRRTVEACAAPRPGRLNLTWISPAIIEAYVRLHEAGHAHSVEVFEDGQLVGGLYGVAIKNVFFTESQFAFRRNASKVALAALNAHLLKWGFRYNDGKDYSHHLAACGFELKRREVLEEALRASVANGAPAQWTYSRDVMLKQLGSLTNAAAVGEASPDRAPCPGSDASGLATITSAGQPA